MKRIACVAATVIACVLSSALAGCSLMGLFDLPPSEGCSSNGDCRALVSFEGGNPCVGVACVSGACIDVTYRDLDGDGFSPIGCDPPPRVGGQGGASGDCDDDDPTTFPDAPERCDRLDNDCDGRRDEGSLSLVDPIVVQASSTQSTVPGIVSAATSRGLGTEIAFVDQLIRETSGPAHATIAMGMLDGPERIDGTSPATLDLNAVALALAPYPGAVRFAALAVSTSSGCAPLQNGAGGELRLLSLPDPITDLDTDLLTPRCVDGETFDAAVHPAIAVDPRSDGAVGAVAYLRQTTRESLGDRSCEDVAATEERDVALFTFRFGRTATVDAAGELECGRMPADGGTVPRISACREAVVEMPAVYQTTFDAGCVCKGEGFGMFAESIATEVSVEPLVAGRTIGDDAIAIAPLEGVGFLAAWPVAGGALEVRRITVRGGEEATPTVDGAAIATLPATSGAWSSPRMVVLDGTPSVVFLVASRGCGAARQVVLHRGETDGASLAFGDERVLASEGGGTGWVAPHEDGVLAAWVEADRLAGARIELDGTAREDRLMLTSDRVRVGAAAAVAGEDGNASMALAVLSSDDPLWTPGVSFARLGCAP